MKVVSIIADSAAQALAKIHEQLGPEAVVLSVRPLPRQGLARFWPKAGSVEVLAGVEEPSPGSAERNPNPRASSPGSFLREKLGSPGRRAPVLHDGTARPHVFIGPPGVGKTTLLCKWLAFSVLNENRTAKVWRLDGVNANTAEFLSVYGELLDVRVERFWSNEPASADLHLIDLPGVSPGDLQGLSSLKAQLAAMATPRVHLVLNAAYETSILVEQFQAFASFQPEDLSLCHLDEEKRPGKLADFVMGTNCCLRFLSTGQKIPGDFVQADEEKALCSGFAG